MSSTWWAVVQAGSVLFDAIACVEKAERLVGQAAASGAGLALCRTAVTGGDPEESDFGTRGPMSCTSN
jgi:hypothetical protein